MILFRALSQFRALFGGDGPSALNRGTTVVSNAAYTALQRLWTLDVIFGTKGGIIQWCTV